MPIPKVLLIGIDAATFDVIDPLVACGKLPTLTRLMQKGVTGELRSTIPPMSPVAWSSLITGMNPGKHGIFGFTRTRSGTYDIELVNGGMRKVPALWQIISDRGQSVGVVNVPMSFPPEPVNGFLISGMDAPGVDTSFTHPKSLLDEIRKEIGDYEIDYLFLERLSEDNIQETLLGLQHMLHLRAKTTQYLMENRLCDFFMVVFIAADRVQHHFWHFSDESHIDYSPLLSKKYGSVVHDTYELIDQYIAELIDQIPDEGIVIVVSDHGFGPFDIRVPFLNMNEWLRSEGLLCTITKEGSRSSLKKPVKRLSISTLRAIRTFLRRHLPSNLRGYLKTRLPRLHEVVESTLFFSNIIWSKTQVYATYDELVSRGLRINLFGREPQGIVSPGEEYEALRNSLVERVEMLRRPDTGERVVKKVHLRESLYHGPQIDNAPDLIIEWADEAFFSKHALLKTQVDCPGLDGDTSNGLQRLYTTGAHRSNGILIAHGRGLRHGIRLGPFDIVDVAPTVLYAMGMPIPVDVDGRVLEELFEDSYLRRRPVTWDTAKASTLLSQIPEYSEEEEKAIRERLRGLGYIE